MRFTNDEVLDAYSDYLDAVEDDIRAAEDGIDGKLTDGYGLSPDDPD